MKKLVEEVVEKENNRKNNKQSSGSDTFQPSSSMQKSYTNNAVDRELEEVLKGLTTTIKVVGCGGAGTNTISRCIDGGIADIDLIAINTDAQHLLQTNAQRKVLINVVHLYLLQ